MTYFWLFCFSLQTGKKLMFRSEPPRMKKKQDKKLDHTTREEEELAYFFSGNYHSKYSFLLLCVCQDSSFTSGACEFHQYRPNNTIRATLSLHNTLLADRIYSFMCFPPLTILTSYLKELKTSNQNTCYQSSMVEQ